jgi:2-dehydro-3-deoxyphosphooctonate aldolase (KDO 8-P synthase)
MIPNLKNIKHNDSKNFFLIAGPCVVEDEATTMLIAETVIEICNKLKIPYIFKASYKKANRSSIGSFTGIGDDEAIAILSKIRNKYQVPVLTDVHSIEDVEKVKNVVDVLQIPAFLCRQTDLVVAAAKTGLIVNIKKGQFLSPESMKFVAEKAAQSGNKNIMLTERGTTFGYQDLIVDYRGLHEMKAFGYPIILDVTHSLQQPNQESGTTGGKPHLIETLAKAGIAVGVDGLFIETHPNPSQAKSDGKNMLHLNSLESLLKKLVVLREAVNSF